MNEPVRNNESALHRILAWSAILPDWAKDALRRIITTGPCTESDIKEIFNFVIGDIKGYSLPSTKSSAIPVSIEHLPPALGDEQSVHLISLSNLQFVNRLPSDQAIPLGGGKGINLIYGNNGSGKSGYARVLKKACRARGTAQNIQPNAFSNTESEPAHACIEYSFGNTIQKFDWVDNYPSDSNLANVFVFDTVASDNYLDSDESACFTPFGLDILPKLVSVYDSIQNMISDEITSLKTRNDKISDKWNYSDNTEVGKYILKLSASSNRQKLDTLSVFTNDMKIKKNDIENSLKSDPEKLIILTEAAINRLKSFSGILDEYIQVIEQDNVKAVLNAIQEYNDASNYNKSVSEKKFKNSRLKGVGTPEWKDLWDKAAEYSNKQVYTTNKFPNTNPDALCVLCQQPFDEEAKNRFLAFDKDINDVSQTTLKEKMAILKNYSDKYNLIADIKSELLKVEADLKVHLNDQQYSSIEKSVDSLFVRFNNIKQIIDRRIYKEFTSIDVSFKDDIASVTLKFKERLELEKSARNPEMRIKHQNDLTDLQDKEWLSNNKDEVIKYLDNLRKISDLEDKKSETKTKNITDFTTELTNIFVTEKFCNTFESELQKLGLNSIKVKLETKRSRKAITQFGLKVVDADKWKIKDIASEGEQRCIALACYLAELSQSSHNSALVFDDPVSSLDYHYRRRIAARIVEESLIRQIIIFTHDIAFLKEIQSASDEIKVPIDIGYLEWFDGKPGFYRKGLPWDTMKPEQRLDELAKLAGQLSKVIQPYPSADDISKIRSLYSGLSSTIERIVETVIFNDVIGRLRGHIQMGKLRFVIGFNSEEHDEIMRLSQKCGSITDRHDPSGPNQNAVPFIDEFINDVTDTRKMLNIIRERQKSAMRK